jgi:ADP-heptose:LPS heptosyltransferase
MTQRPRILLVRDGAIGDTIMMTPLIRHWDLQGYDVHVACKRYVGDAVLPFNPHVAGLHELPNQDGMGQRRNKIKELRDLIKPEIDLDLAGSCEGAFLYHSNRNEYNLPLSWRQANAKGKNYYQHACCTLGGATRYDPEMFAGSQEDQWWTRFRAMHLGWKIIQIQITGSSINKCYPWIPEVVVGLQKKYPKSMIITTGDPQGGPIIQVACVEAGADPKRMWATCGDKRYTLRDSLITTKYVDLVIGPETGIINASACWDTPKVVLLSHSSIDNLCRGWKNCYPIQGRAKCSPCYKIVSYEDTCDMITVEEDPRIAGATRCLAAITPDEVLTMADIAMRNGRALV